MTEAGKQRKALDVLRSLNIAVSTTKLYPPSFPQVAKAVETAFDQISIFLRKYGELSFSWIEDEPKLFGLTVSHKFLGKTDGKDLFQQLRLLNISHVVLRRGLTSKTFQQLLIFFTTSPQQINREGGGRAFVAGLNLDHIFPLHSSVSLPSTREDGFARRYHYYREQQALTDEVISSLSEDFDGETVEERRRISRMIDTLQHPEEGTVLVLASITGVLRGCYRNGTIFFPPEMGLVFKNINRIADHDKKRELAAAVAGSLVSDLDEFALHVVLLQNFSGGFANELYDQILSRLNTGLDGVARLMWEEAAQVDSMLGKDSVQYRQIVKGCKRLFTTEKGKQVLAREKTRMVIEAGEKERQAKRVQAGIAAILQGDVNGIKNKEILKQLPVTIESLISKGKISLAATIIENITREVMKGDAATQDLLSQSLSLIGGSLIKAGKWDWLEKLAVPLMGWVKVTDKADPYFEKVITILQETLEYYWKNDKNDKADRILQLFFAIRTGKLKKSAKVVEVVSRVQDLAVVRTPLSSLLAGSLKKENELVDRRLIMQGPIVARFLLNALFSTEKIGEKMKILDLLERMGPLLPPVLLEKLAEPMPGRDRRYLIQLLSETGDGKSVENVFEYLNHEDIRVQKAAFSCICRLSRKDKKTNLLKALTLASGHMREQVVRELAPLADDEVVDRVATLLEDWLHFPAESRNSLLVQIFALLLKHKNARGEEAVEQFLQIERKAKEKMLAASVWLAAEPALRQIRRHNRETSKKEVLKAGQNEMTSGDEETMDMAQQKQIGSSAAEEARIRNMLAKGNVDEARKALVELIYQAAEQKRFTEAENLREWLIKIEPMSLTDIIRAAEIIEEQKSASINKDYLQVWADLYDNLTTEEFNGLYYSMEHKIYNEEVSLVEQKMSRPELLFINSGQVKLYYNDKNSEELVKVARQGDILGVDTFFDASLWTISAATLTRSDISSLNLKNIKNWEKDFPALESKLHDFCRKFNELDKDLQKLGKNRRGDKRYPVGGRVTVVILDHNGKETGIQIKGELADVSSGGISFALRISQKKNARIVLGRNVRIQVSSNAGQLKRFDIEGVLATVRSLYSVYNEYSAHVRFRRQLTEEELRGIIDAGMTVSE